MKKITLAAILIVMAFSVAFGQSGKSGISDNKDERDVRQFVSDFAAAFQNNDAAALGRAFSDNYVFVNPAGALQNKKQRVDEVGSGDRKYEQAKYDEVTVRVYGNTAIVTARVTVKGTSKGVPFSGQFRSLLTLMKIKGKWQLIASQANQLQVT